MNELRKIAENYMRNELVRVDGIADIQLNGQEQAIRRNIHESLYVGGIRINCRRDCLANHGHQSKCFRGNDHGRGYSIHGERGKPGYSLQDIENIIVAFKENSSSGSSSSTESTSSSSKTKAPVYLKDVASVSIRTKTRKICPL